MIVKCKSGHEEVQWNCCTLKEIWCWYCTTGEGRDWSDRLASAEYRIATQ